VRALVKEHFRVDLCPADVEIVPDGYGRPQVAGAWTRQIGMTPAVSISHTRGMAVALASLEPGQMVGIDIESLTHSRGDFQSVAFSEPERRILDTMPQDVRDEWSLRMWCAKEAVAKALGRGFAEVCRRSRSPRRKLKMEWSNSICKGACCMSSRSLRGRPMIAYTSRGKDFVFSTIVYQQGAVQ